MIIHSVMNVQPVKWYVVAMVQYSYSHCTSELACLHRYLAPWD